MPKYHMPNLKDSLLFKGQKRERKEKEKTPSAMVGRVGTLGESQCTVG
jgi:hypothetical protein